MIHFSPESASYQIPHQENSDHCQTGCAPAPLANALDHLDNLIYRLKHLL